MTFTCEQFLNVDGLICVEIDAVLYGKAALITLTIVVVALFGLFWLTGKVLVVLVVVLVVVELVLVVAILPSN